MLARKHLKHRKNACVNVAGCIKHFECSEQTLCKNQSTKSTKSVRGGWGHRPQAGGVVGVNRPDNNYYNKREIDLMWQQRLYQD